MKKRLTGMSKNLLIAACALFVVALFIPAASGLAQTPILTPVVNFPLIHTNNTMTPTVTLTRTSTPSPTPTSTFTPSPTATATTAPPAFFYSTSYYMQTVNTQTLYNMGCVDGQQDATYGGVQDRMVILDFGQPWGETVNGELILGTSMFGGSGFVKIGQIYTAVLEYAHGYYVCTGTDRASHLTIGVGTSNYGTSWFRSITNSRYNAWEHGRTWAQMVESLAAELITRGYSSQVTIYGANDIELSWNTYFYTDQWVQGYESAWNGTNLYYDYGACEGCPTRLNPGASSPNSWTREQIWRIAWGATPAMPFPEIYATSGVNALQWAYLSYYSYLNHGIKMTFNGVMTEYQACLQRGGCTGIDNTPLAGYTQMLNELNHAYYGSSIAQSSIRWTTDIRWPPYPTPSP